MTNESSASSTGATIHDAAQKFASQASDAGERMARQIADAGKTVGQQVQEQPWAAAITAGVLGLAIGFLLGRESVPPPRTARDYVDEYLPRKMRRR
jgi:ElaB/YqjD/DUF883 family membrane-anchored ribosome-binding protein